MDTQGKQPEAEASPHSTSYDAIFDQVWAANQAAFAEGDFETACHSLQAALARAYYRHDAVQVEAVGQQAAEQHNLIFQQDPDMSRPLRPDLHPVRRDAIRMVYVSIARQAPAITDLIQRET